MITLDDILAAQQRIKSTIYHSPCPASQTMSRLCGCRTFFKLENLQMTGSFKERGALNKLLLLTEAGCRTGVIAASAGKRGQPRAGRGKPRHPARPRLDHRHAAAHASGQGRQYPQPRRRSGASRGQLRRSLCPCPRIGRRARAGIPARFEDEAVIAGQGTIGLELLNEPVAFDAVVAPVGGGGLISGLAVALKECRPDIRVIGVEPENFASMSAALGANQPVDIAAHPTIADGLAVRRVSQRTLALTRHYVDEVVTVSEGEIASAMLKLLEIEKTVAEGGGAAALAAVYFHKIAGLEGRNVAIIIGGGNVDPNLLSKIIERGLAKDGRMVRIRSLVRDRPGELARICEQVAATGANILDVVHNRAFANLEIGGVEIDLTLETRGPAHVEELLAKLGAEGIDVHTDFATNKEPPAGPDNSFRLGP